MINLIKNLRQILHDSNKIKESNTINDINFKNENQNIKIKIEIDNNYKPVNNKNKNNFQDYNKFENNQTKNKNIDIFEENSNKKINESNLENDILYNQKKKEIIDNIKQKINKDENNLQNYDYIQYNQKRNNNKEIIEENKNKENIEENKNKEINKNINNEKEIDIFEDTNENFIESEKINYPPINNNIEINIGIQQLIENYETENKIKIKKELLKNINCFIACLGPPGSGKSTICSNYYKTLYNVKNDYFESSDENLSFTKGIWLISDSERRKIPKMVIKDLLDVEGFQVDDIKSWKYIMIIAFLSTDLIILNRNPRYDDVKKMIKIIENSLKKMKDKQMPKILKNIFIQTISKKPKKTIKEMLEEFHYNKDIFIGINFKYIYLPIIDEESLVNYNNDLLKSPLYKKNFEEILQHLILIKKYNAVSSLINYVDDFNETINGNSGFNSQSIIQDIKSDFIGVYSRYEKMLRNKLYNKISELKKVENLEETFEKFIKK